MDPSSGKAREKVFLELRCKSVTLKPQGNLYSYPSANYSVD